MVDITVSEKTDHVIIGEKMENNIYYNKADGHGYFFDGNNWQMMPRFANGDYDYECISRVDEMQDHGCSQEMIDAVYTFIRYNRRSKTCN